MAHDWEIKHWHVLLGTLISVSTVSVFVMQQTWTSGKQEQGRKVPRQGTGYRYRAWHEGMRSRNSGLLVVSGSSTLSHYREEDLPQDCCPNNPGSYQPSMVLLDRISKMSYVFLLKALGTAQKCAQQNERGVVTEFLRTHSLKGKRRPAGGQRTKPSGGDWALPQPRGWDQSPSSHRSPLWAQRPSQQAAIHTSHPWRLLFMLKKLSHSIVCFWSRVLLDPLFTALVSYCEWCNGQAIYEGRDG